MCVAGVIIHKIYDVSLVLKMFVIILNKTYHFLNSLQIWESDVRWSM
ncbi:hypothetical protein CHISP_1461 [Chitinispirillum alkaliphilum]|nr:hypothetical protein CHISP_1461 [Chitinispirillum alkaliphilum]